MLQTTPHSPSTQAHGTGYVISVAELFPGMPLRTSWERESERPGFVYVAYSDGNGCKIGRTCQKDPVQRVMQCNTCVKKPYTLIGAIHCSNPSDLELFMHKQLDAHRVGVHNKELFDVDVETARAFLNKTKEAMHTMGLTDGAHTKIDINKLATFFPSNQVEDTEMGKQTHMSSDKSEPFKQHKTKQAVMPHTQPVGSAVTGVDDASEEMTPKKRKGGNETVDAEEQANILKLPQINPNASIRVQWLQGKHKMSVVDLIMALTGRDRKQSHKMIENALKNTEHGEKAQRLLWDKHQFPGAGQRLTYMLTIDEALEFLDCLPDRYTDDVNAYIRTQFLLVTKGDASLHDEIDRNAQRKGVLPTLAREALGLKGSVASVVTEDPTDRLLKHRKLMAVIEAQQAVTQQLRLQTAKQAQQLLEGVTTSTHLDAKGKQLLREFTLNSLL
eukprot:3326004-Rhodomonas_salina.2